MKAYSLPLFTNLEMLNLQTPEDFTQVAGSIPTTSMINKEYLQ